MPLLQAMGQTQIITINIRIDDIWHYWYWILWIKLVAGLCINYQWLNVDKAVHQPYGLMLEIATQYPNMYHGNLTQQVISSRAQKVSGFTRWMSLIINELSTVQPATNLLNLPQSPCWEKSRIDGDNSQHQAGFEGSKAVCFCYATFRVWPWEHIGSWNIHMLILFP